MATDPNALPGAPVRTADPVSTSPGALAPMPAQAPAPPSKAPQLAAAAQNGQAGIDAYHTAASQLAQLQQNAVQNAQARAKLIGGPESQGFENIANQFYTRGQANLASSNAAFQDQQGANKAAYDKYFAGLKNDMPGINDYLNTKLAQYETKKKAAYFPKDEIMGATNLALPGAQKDASDAQSKVSSLQAQLDQQTSHAFTKPLQDEMAKNGQRLAEIDDYSRSHAGRVPGYLKTEQQDLLRKQGIIEGHLRLGTATEQRKIAELTPQLAQAQQDYDAKNQFTSPGALAQHIASTRYGVSPEKAAGLFSDSKFVTPQGTTNVLDTQKYGAKAVGLAQKLNIDGGAANVSQLMNTPEYKETVAEAQKLATGGGAKFNDVKHHIMTQYASAPNLVKLILDEIGGYGWKKA